MTAERLQVTAEDARMKLARATDLSARQLIAAVELDAADVAVRSADAQVRSARAQVTQARAGLTQAEVNLSKTVIASPIDGIVIARNVDVGQTVASDLGAIREGQAVAFTVDAYPNERFAGRVEQVRLNPVVTSNVVTYAAIVSAPNPDLKLKPGMTANLTVEAARRDEVLRVPAAAIRFRPDAAVLEAYGATAVTTKLDEGTATVWQIVGEHLQPHRVRIGLTDGTHVEIEAGDLAEGTLVVTRAEPTTAAPQTGTTSPLMPSSPRR